MQQSEKMNAFGWITEIIFWIKTFLSPFFIWIIVGLIFLFTIDSQTGLYLFWLIIALGAVGGIVWATRISRKQGNAEFHKGLMATSGMDVFNENKISK